MKVMYIKKVTLKTTINLLNINVARPSSKEELHNNLLTFKLGLSRHIVHVNFPSS